MPESPHTGQTTTGDSLAHHPYGRQGFRTEVGMGDRPSYLFRQVRPAQPEARLARSGATRLGGDEVFDSDDDRIYVGPAVAERET